MGMRRGFHLLGVVAILSCYAATGESAEKEVKGRVLNPDGQPVRNAIVRIYYQPDLSGYGCRWVAETKCGDDGRFTLTLPGITPNAVVLDPPRAADLYLVATAPDCAAAISEVFPDKFDYEIRLSLGRAIACTVMDGLGKPVQDAEVSLERADMLGTRVGGIGHGPTPRSRLLQAIYAAKTDDHGRAVLKDCPTAPLGLKVCHRTRGESQKDVQETRDETQIFLRGVVTVLRGTVIDGEGKRPLKGMLVVPSFSWVFPGVWSETDAEGRFQLALPTETVPIGLGVVAIDPVAAPAYACSLERLPAGNVPANITILMGPGKLVEAKVTGARTKENAAGAVVSANAMLGGANMVLRRITDANGVVAFRLDANSATVSATLPPPGFARVDQVGEVKVDLTPEKIEPVNLTMDFVPQVRLTAITVRPDGAKIARVNVVVRQPSSSPILSVSNSDGVCELSGIAEGQPAQLYAITQDRTLAAMMPIDVVKTGMGAISLNLSTTRTGTVLCQDAGGAKLDAFVTVSLAAKQETAEYTVAQSRTQAGTGTCRIECLLPEAEYVVKAYAPNYRANQTAGMPWRIGRDDNEPAITVLFDKRSPAPVRQPKGN
jgi:hypothetical protein